MLSEKLPHIGTRPIENSSNVVVSCRPRILQKHLCALLIFGEKAVPQPIESFAQGAPPLLVPAGTASSIASAVAFPAANAVRTTPGSSLFDPYFPRRRIHREVFAVICQAG